MRWNAYKLIAVGLAVFSLYAAGFYFLADSSLNSEALRLPLVFRGFSYAVLSIALMWCLHEIMSFQHFFQALSIFNILHMFVGGLAGAALHARGLNYYVADGFARYSGYLDEVRGLQTPVDFARYMEQMVENLLAQSVKILFGWTLYARPVLCPVDAALGHTRRAPPREAYANLAACGLAGAQRRASPTKIAPLATQTEQNGIRVCFVIFSTWPKAKAGRSRGGGRR